ncbi:MAG: hypothetical protein J6B90_09240 [Lachnospiraceae bacterium]|nr:hypothetical protein [Lachnospiraceae bacterium]
MLFLEKGKKIVVWGIGRIGSKVIKKWGESYHICFAIDEKAESVSLEYLGYRVYGVSKLAELADDDLMLVVAMEDWKSVMPQLADLGMQMFRHWVPFSLLEYDCINPDFCYLLNTEEEKKYAFKRLAQGKLILSTYGMCHMTAYKRMLLSSSEFAEKYILIDLPAINAGTHANYALLQENTVWSSCDLILYSSYSMGFYRDSPDVPDPDQLVAMLDKNCRIISITSAAFKGYFPQHIAPPYFTPEIRYKYAWGDKNIDKMIIAGTTDDEIITAIVSADFYPEEYVERFFNHSLKILEGAEENCVIKIADYIRENFKDKLLYYSCTHPIVEVLLEIGRRLCNELGITDVRYESFLTDPWFQMDTNEELIYPCVKRLVKNCNEERRMNPGHYYAGDKKLTELEYLKGYIETVRMVLK